MQMERNEEKFDRERESEARVGEGEVVKREAKWQAGTESRRQDDDVLASH